MYSIKTPGGAGPEKVYHLGGHREKYAFLKDAYDNMSNFRDLKSLLLS
jgi:hypothetical protein